jgi:hypothetical protein
MKNGTNFDEFEAHMKRFLPNMIQSEELKKASFDSFDIMYKNVMNRLKMTDYDYNQSGDFLGLMRSEGDGKGEGNPKIGRTKIQIGFGGYEEGLSGELNSQLYMRKKQSHTIRKWSGYTSFETEAEKEMPKWILMEFGRSGTENTADKVPRQFKVPYTSRSSKNMMVGPSDNMLDYTKKADKSISKAKSEGRTPTDDDYGMLRFYGNSGARKPTYAMFTPEGAEHTYGGGKPHPGMRAGRFFRNGLEDSKKPIYDRYGDAIKKYLNSINAK